MKNFTLSKNIFLTLTLFVLAGIFSRVSAATFTAVASGNWSSQTTWGGPAPSFNLTSDQVIIPAFLTVSLDNNLTVNGVTASLNIQGTLTAVSSADSLELGFGAITGDGSITLQAVKLDSSALLAFTGTLSAELLYSSSLAIQSAASITVAQTLVLQGGVFTLSQGGLTLASNAVVNIEGGALVNSGAVLDLTSSYNVVYSNSSATTGLELSGSGLNNVTVNVPDSNTVTLSGNLTVNGTLSLQSGYLALNGHTLHLSGNLATGGTGTIASTNNSSINISTASSPTGALQFAGGANVIKNLTVNVSGFNGVVTLGSDLTVYGNLTFTSGSLNVQNHGLTISSSGAVVNAGSSSYVITADSGYLAQQLTAGANNATTFDVGTLAHYTPATVQLASGSASGMVMVGVANSVLAQGTSGNDLSANQALVDATWFVHSDISSNLNLTLGVSWPASLEVNGFIRDTAYIAHYTGGQWDQSSYLSAQAAGSGMYSIQRTGITSLSPFAVFGNHVATAVNEVEDARFVVYPNPVGNNVFVTTTLSNEKVNVDIVDLQGKVVKHLILTDMTSDISTAQLAQGTYFIKLYNDKLNVIKKIVKS